MSLDPIDLAILGILQKNALATLKDISAEINLSVSPTHDRIKRLEADGVIANYVALINRKKIDLGMVVFCHVTLDKQTLKVVTKDVETYNQFYQEKLAVLPMVAHINSLFVMDEIKTTTALPL